MGGSGCGVCGGWRRCGVGGATGVGVGSGREWEWEREYHRHRHRHRHHPVVAGVAVEVVAEAVVEAEEAGVFIPQRVCHILRSIIVSNLN